MKFSNISFIEIAVNNFEEVKNNFLKLGFHEKAVHRWKKILIMKQNSLYVILNCMATSHAIKSFVESGNSICGVGISCYSLIEKMSVFSLIYKQLYNAFEVMPFIGNCQLYLFDKRKPFFESGEWVLNKKTQKNQSHFAGFEHITFAVNPGNMGYWTKYVEEKLLDLRSTLDRDFKGYSGMNSAVFVSSSGKVKISIVEPMDESSWVKKFLGSCKNEGVKHLVFEKNNVLSTIEDSEENKVFSFEIMKQNNDGNICNRW